MRRILKPHKKYDTVDGATNEEVTLFPEAALPHFVVGCAACLGEVGRDFNRTRQFIPFLLNALQMCSVCFKTVRRKFNRIGQFRLILLNSHLMRAVCAPLYPDKRLPDITCNPKMSTKLNRKT